MLRQRRLLLFIAIVVIAVLLSFNLTRQFIKMTALFMLPVVLLYMLGARLRPRSIGRTMIAALMLVVVIVYGIQLYHLPVKAKVWDLNEQGAALVATGRYNEARQVYQKIGELGDTNTMQKKLAALDEQEGYDKALKQAQQLIREGRAQEAAALLKEIPVSAGCYREARQLLKELKSQ